MRGTNDPYCIKRLSCNPIKVVDVDKKPPNDNIRRPAFGVCIVLVYFDIYQSVTIDSTLQLS